MDDYISRQAVIDAIANLRDTYFESWDEPLISADVIIEMIRDMPSEESEQRTGEWHVLDECANDARRKKRRNE